MSNMANSSAVLNLRWISNHDSTVVLKSLKVPNVLRNSLYSTEGTSFLWIKMTFASSFSDNFCRISLFSAMFRIQLFAFNFQPTASNATFLILRASSLVMPTSFSPKWITITFLNVVPYASVSILLINVWASLLFAYRKEKFTRKIFSFGKEIYPENDLLSTNQLIWLCSYRSH